ncbi:MAG TPA: glycosyl hydrolase 53 family protein [Saprospiraceae bacterium]|nr:glycosyl hydrolase 53 family protein [Saprospiraceae bacterium]
MLKSINLLSVLFLLLFTNACADKNGNEVDPMEEVIPAKYDPSKFVMGVDLSYVNAVEDAGGVYKDENGQVVDPFVYLQKKGANLVRVRLWHTPSWQIPLHGAIKYSHLADVSKTIKRAKAAGMQVNLDLHYSDDWADPQKQQTPKAWQGLSLKLLQDSIYNYTKQVLESLASQNLTPEYIQVGNENNGGMCFPVGQISNNNYTNFASLLKSGIKAVRDFSQTATIKPKIILHVAQLQNAEWWANGVVNNGGVTDFDILGLSHYFIWSEINNNNGVKTTIANLKFKYKKEVMIVETAYPFTSDSNDNYGNIISGQTGAPNYEVSTTGQLNYMKDLCQAVIDGGGKGVMYWEPAWITSTMKDQWGVGSSWENNAFFDYSSKGLPVLDYLTFPYKF